MHPDWTIWTLETTLIAYDGNNERFQNAVRNIDLVNTSGNAGGTRNSAARLVSCEAIKQTRPARTW